MDNHEQNTVKQISEEILSAISDFIKEHTPSAAPAGKLPAKSPKPIIAGKSPDEITESFRKTVSEIKANKTALKPHTASRRLNRKMLRGKSISPQSKLKDFLLKHKETDKSGQK